MNRRYEKEKFDYFIGMLYYKLCREPDTIVCVESQNEAIKIITRLNKENKIHHGLKSNQRIFFELYNKKSLSVKMEAR